jgi:hypothetical protein
MSINLPNRFECASRTLVFDGPTSVDFRPLAQRGIPDELAGQLVTSRFLVTLSDVVSTSSGADTFRFREALLKIPVTVLDREFLFPVAGFVDHEYSLARGYLLGFNKYFMNRPAVPFTLCQDGFELDARTFATAGSLEYEDLPQEHGRPLLLWADYSVGAARWRGYGTLVVENYTAKRLSRLGVPATQRVLGHQMSPVRAYEVCDEFVVADVNHLAGDESREQ